ncbi:MAG TPA: hypothetical protein VFU63_01945 [Ktedonobacterales bacterium]|nr:hypothetical protein [Ktedonobacterales bacterium]
MQEPEEESQRGSEKGRDGQYDAERRVQYLAPLVAYLREHHHIGLPIVREACARAVEAGEEPMLVHGNWLPMMQRGQRRVPPWLVEQCCAVIGRTVEEVMGAEWVKRFGPDGRGGAEIAPTGVVRRQRTWGIHRRAATGDAEGAQESQKATQAA